MEKPKAVLLDAYGTLFDVYSVKLPFEELGTQPERTGDGLRDVLSFF